MRTRSQFRRCMRRRHGFTLIEVLLVMIILVILGSLGVNVFTGTRDKANVDAANIQVSLLTDPMNRYRLQMNTYPEKLEELWEEPSDSDEAENWSGPYMEKLGNDPWGNPYQYLAEGEKNPDKFDFWSYGPDGEDGTDDDIGNWDQEE